MTDYHFMVTTDWASWTTFAQRLGIEVDVGDESVPAPGVSVDKIDDLVVVPGVYDEDGNQTAAPVMGGKHANVRVDNAAVEAAVEKEFA